MKLLLIITFSLSCFVAILSCEAQAELIAYEGFDYPAGNLSGLDGGFGWDGGWGVGSDAVIEAGSLDYSDGMSSLPTVGNHVLVGGPDGSQSTAVRSMFSDLGLSAGTYWMSFVGQRLLPHPDTPNNYARAAAFQLQLQGSSTSEQFSVGKVTTPTSGTVTQTWDVFSIQVDGSSSSTGVDQATQILALMQVIVNGDNDDVNDDDTVNLWVNPSLDENAPLGAPDAINSGIDDYLFDGVRIFAGGTNDDGLYAQLAIDEIRIGTELKDALTGVIVFGDTNGDGEVTASDLTPIRTNYRQAVTFRSQGDLNGDGTVSFADFRQFKTALLNQGGSLADLDLGFLSVPEPTSIWLMTLGGLIPLLRRKRGASKDHFVVAEFLRIRRTWAADSVGCRSLTTSPTGLRASATGWLKCYRRASFWLSGVVALVYAVPAFAVISIPVTDDAYTSNDPNKGPTVTNNRTESTAFLEVRNHEAPRKKIGYIKYAVGGFPANVYANATLSGSFNDGYDNAGTWNIYGLNDGELNLDDVPDGSFGELNWTEGQLSYSQGLGVDVTVPVEPSTDLGLDLTEITFLGTIAIPGDAPFESNPTDLPLGDFLGADTNGVVTFMLTDANLSGNEWRVQTKENESSPGVLLNLDCDAGDTNCDGTIDVDTDLAAIAAHFRQDVTGRVDGDLNFDGTVDFTDFDEWKRNYTGSLSGIDLSFLQTVPEPGSLSLLALATFAWLVRSRQTRNV